MASADKENEIEQKDDVINEQKEDITIENKNEKNNEEKNEGNFNENKFDDNTNKKKWVIISIIIGSIIILGIIFSTAFALVNIPNTRILKGISIEGIDVGNLTIEQATGKIKDILNEQLSKDIEMEYKEFNTTINPEQIEFTYYIENAINDAYKTGRSGNILENNYEILKTIIGPYNISIAYSYNEESINALISSAEANLPEARKQYSYYIENENLIITPGKKGIVIQKDRLEQLIIEGIKSREPEHKYLTIPVQIMEPDKIDIDKIHDEVYAEPKDAYYTTSPFVIYPEVIGVDFNVDDAREILKTEQEEYVIGLTLTMPEFTKQQIGTEVFPDLLSTSSTKYDVTNRNRSNNLKLASDKINGVVLMPGEEFSYNKIVGERTIAAGYKEAKIYSNGQVIDGLGGGICQISSTLYNSVLKANLEVTERRNHQFVTSYLKAGLDATVVYGSTDFKFVNSRQYPIKIVSEVKNGVATIDIYGVKEPVEYDIRIDSTVINYIPYSTKTIKDSSLPAGTEKVDQKGSNGVKTVTYKYLILNGNIVDKIAISHDTYNPMQKIVRVGSGAVTKEDKTDADTDADFVE